MDDPNYPLNYYDHPIDYPKEKGKEATMSGSIIGENENSELTEPEENNTITFDNNKLSKNSNILINVNKIEKGNNIL
jgi:hypothetical protein